MVEHVCGPDPQNAMYVDAVTVEEGQPWYEMKQVRGCVPT